MPLHLVGEVATCAFCWRTVPTEELRAGDDGRVTCRDEATCCDEFARWDYGGRWSEHPAFEQMGLRAS